MYKFTRRTRYITLTLGLVTSANSPTVVEEIFYFNYLEFLKACFKIIHCKNTLDSVFNCNMRFENPKNYNSIILLNMNNCPINSTINSSTVEE